MSKKKASLFSKMALLIVSSLMIIGVLGRDYFVLGTMLIVLRWPFLLIAAIVIYWMKKRVVPKMVKIIVALTLIVVSFETAWNMTHKQELSNGGAGNEISLMTYNIFFQNQDKGHAINKVEEYQPDILAVQELTPRWELELEKSIRDKYPFHKTIPLNGTHGLGIYSKFKISEHQVLRNDDGRPFAQIIQLIVHGKSVQLINLHLASPAIAVENPDRFMTLLLANYKMREGQLKQIELATKGNKNFDVQLLMGDLNTTRYEPLYRKLTYSWVDLYTQVGDWPGVNFPNNTESPSFLTLDYIFLRGTGEMSEAVVVDGGSSDHKAIAGIIKI